MPSPEWNRRWVDEMESQREANYAYYGQHWGDPDPVNLFPSRIQARFSRQRLVQLSQVPGAIPLLMLLPRNNIGSRRLVLFLHRYLRPHIRPGITVLEIGSGGGRWTNYMLEAAKIIVVELNAEFFDTLRQRFSQQLAKFQFYQTRDYEMDGIPDQSVDFVFSFGTFVHIEPEGIQQYLQQIARVLKPGSKAVIQYANKETQRGQERTGFSEMVPAKMETFVKDTPGLHIVTHDTELLPHSSVIVLHKA